MLYHETLKQEIVAVIWNVELEKRKENQNYQPLFGNFEQSKLPYKEQNR